MVVVVVVVVLGKLCFVGDELETQPEGLER